MSLFIALPTTVGAHLGKPEVFRRQSVDLFELLKLSVRGFPFHEAVSQDANILSIRRARSRADSRSDAWSEGCSEIAHPE